MAKMKIYEIARSIQQQDKNIKSGDLVTLLNENGFEVKVQTAISKTKQLDF
ncbi:MAG: hypothetical protein ACLSD6_00060 [Clostridium sp.]